MTTKENYVSQVFHQELCRYPSLCHGITTPFSYERFNIQFVPPQYNPLNVKKDMPEFYHQIHQYIIESILSMFRRNKKRLEVNLFDVLDSLEKKQLEFMLKKYLSLVGKTHLWFKEWNFLDHVRYRQRLRNRIKYIRKDLIYMIRKALNDLAYCERDIPKDLRVFMKMLLIGLNQD